MKRISGDYLKKFQPVKEDSTWYRELGKEMTQYFGKNCFWIPFRHERWKIISKFKQIQEIEDSKKNKSLAYFLGMLDDR
jgi:hypothetical protein